ncbi:COP23 domain-containing protein [Microcoleus sp. Pol11C2]|uniref:COP23 domain-containing protein n=1 Tax=Microcoleus sp. Pol11C2 TaxID=3055389 RepID=UPI002FD08BF6
MKSQWLASLSCLAMAVAGMVTLTSEAQAERLPAPRGIPIGPSNPNPPTPPPGPRPPAMTTVSCAGTVTVAQRNGGEPKVIFIWSTNYFGEQYSPETRCQEVSSRLHNAVMANGGSFAGIRFESGVVNRLLVVCVLGKGQSQCNSGNQLFTLKPENRPRVRQILEELTNFSASKKASTGIVEDNGEGIQVDISDLEQELGTSDPSYAPQSPSQPDPNDLL